MRTGLHGLAAAVIALLTMQTLQMPRAHAGVGAAGSDFQAVYTGNGSRASASHATFAPCGGQMDHGTGDDRCGSVTGGPAGGNPDLN